MVVDEGLGGDESYIVEGLLRARPGLPVTPQDPAPPPDPKAPESAPPTESSAPAKSD